MAASRRCVQLALAVLIVVAATATAISFDDLDVYEPVLPAYIAKDDTIDDVELRVYLPTANSVIASGTVVRVTPTCSALAFSPSSFVFTVSESVVHFSIEALTSGAFTIDYVAAEVPPDAAEQTNTSTVTAVLLFSQTIHVLPSPASFNLSDAEWHGVVLLNDSFDAPPSPAGTFTASAFWSHLAHGYPSSACGAYDGDRALYFTALGDRFADTAALNLLGFHGKMHFHHVYGAHAGQSYDRAGDNRISCELVDADEETVFSYLPLGQDACNHSAWQSLYEVPLPPPETNASLGVFSAHSVLLPTLSMHTAAQFRWKQKNHSSFPLDVASGLSLDALLAAANDNSSVNGELGRNERELWHYRNLFDQWALDNVRLEVRLNVPLFSIESDSSSSADGTTAVTVQSPIPRSWVELLVGDGTHAFPSCNNATVASAPPQSMRVRLDASGYVHAVACLRVNALLISSFPARSPRVLVQARRPRFTNTLDATASVDTWHVTLACDGCDFMRFTQSVGDGSDWREHDAPSCTYGTLVNATSRVVAVTSNARLQVVACGHGLVASAIVASEPYTVRPRAPTFVFASPEITVMRYINVTVVPPDTVSVGVVFTVGANVELPDCSSIVTDAGAAAAMAGTRTVQVDVADVVRAVACCVDRACEDSDIAVWGPLAVRAAAPVFATACSRVKPLTIVVELQPVTTHASVRYHIGPLTAPLTCTSGIEYTAHFEVSAVSTIVYAISCGTGLLVSACVEIPVQVDACCAGLDAHQHPWCAHVLLLADDFRSCLDASKWTAVTRQWGGDGVNGGVHVSNVACERDDALDKPVLALSAHGDLFPSSSPVGSVHTGDGDSTLRALTVDDALLQWALDGESPVPCNDLARCAARRVGAAVETKLALTAGVLVLRLKPCDAFGTLTQVWWGEYADSELLTTVPFLPLWKAALYQAKTSADAPFVHSSPRAGDAYVELAMQWDAIEGRANLYVDGALVLQQLSASTSTNSNNNSLVNSTLSLGVWFPNAVAGEPLFQSCRVLVDSVQVFKLEVAGGRWCDIHDMQQRSVRCTSDADCRAHVTQHCFMDIYEAVCTSHHDELEAFPDADTDAQEQGVNAASSVSKHCNFRLEPSARSSLSVTDMSSREQRLQWATGQT